MVLKNSSHGVSLLLSPFTADPRSPSGSTAAAGSSHRFVRPTRSNTMWYMPLGGDLSCCCSPTHTICPAIFNRTDSCMDDDAHDSHPNRYCEDAAAASDFWLRFPTKRMAVNYWHGWCRNHHTQTHPCGHAPLFQPTSDKVLPSLFPTASTTSRSLGSSNAPPAYSATAARPGTVAIPSLTAPPSLHPPPAHSHSPPSDTSSDDSVVDISDGDDEEEAVRDAGAGEAAQAWAFFLGRPLSMAERAAVDVLERAMGDVPISIQVGRNHRRLSFTTLRAPENKAAPSVSRPPSRSPAALVSAPHAPAHRSHNAQGPSASSHRLPNAPPPLLPSRLFHKTTKGNPSSMAVAVQLEPDDPAPVQNSAPGPS
ncbi:hypothetical protein C8F01DRAFT_1092105 [Mycena amicta]|nr:hypothetical protein C8F01DRAFT_1092105 [Mycena amicta]